MPLSPLDSKTFRIRTFGYSCLFFLPWVTFKTSTNWDFTGGTQLERIWGWNPILQVPPPPKLLGINNFVAESLGGEGKAGKGPGHWNGGMGGYSGQYIFPKQQRRIQYSNNWYGHYISIPTSAMSIFVISLGTECIVPGNRYFINIYWNKQDVS